MVREIHLLCLNLKVTLYENATRVCMPQPEGITDGIDGNKDRFDDDIMGAQVFGEHWPYALNKFTLVGSIKPVTVAGAWWRPGSSRRPESRER